VAHVFTPRRIESARAALRARVRARLAALAPGRVLDFQREVADPLAREAISDQLGVPEAEAATFSGWVAALLALAPAAAPAERAAADAAAASLFAYLAELAARRRREPGDSLLDSLLAAEDAAGGISETDLEQVVMSLLIGGTDTTRSFLGIVTSLLLQRPEARARLAAAPELAPAFVEEALRFEPPLAGVPRVATEELSLGGCTIPAGSPVILELLSANRDPRRFPEPDRFEPLRDASAHLTFGRGTHFCVGAALARMEAQELLLGLAAEQAPRLALVEKPRWVPFSPARRLEALRVAVG
jgi:cytochrome P450